MNVLAKRNGWRFFQKPKGLELAFLNTWNLPLLPFFIFFGFVSKLELSLVNALFGQGYRFLFAYWGCCDWFHEKLMPLKSVQFTVLSVQKEMCIVTVLASAFRETNVWGGSEQIKNDTLAVIWFYGCQI